MRSTFTHYQRCHFVIPGHSVLYIHYMMASALRRLENSCMQLDNLRHTMFMSNHICLLHTDCTRLNQIKHRSKKSTMSSQFWINRTAQLTSTCLFRCTGYACFDYVPFVNICMYILNYGLEDLLHSLLSGHSFLSSYEMLTDSTAYNCRDIMHATWTRTDYCKDSIGECMCQCWNRWWNTWRENSPSDVRIAKSNRFDSIIIVN